MNFFDNLSVVLEYFCYFDFNVKDIMQISMSLYMRLTCREIYFNAVALLIIVNEPPIFE